MGDKPKMMCYPNLNNSDGAELCVRDDPQFSDDSCSFLKEGNEPEQCGAYRPAPSLKKCPEVIYLQPHMHPEITWCEDQTEDTDVKYIRADVVTKSPAEAKMEVSDGRNKG